MNFPFLLQSNVPQGFNDQWGVLKTWQWSCFHQKKTNYKCTSFSKLCCLSLMMLSIYFPYFWVKSDLLVKKLLKTGSIYETWLPSLVLFGLLVVPMVQYLDFSQSGECWTNTRINIVNKIYINRYYSIIKLV